MTTNSGSGGSKHGVFSLPMQVATDDTKLDETLKKIAQLKSEIDAINKDCESLGKGGKTPGGNGSTHPPGQSTGPHSTPTKERFNKPKGSGGSFGGSERSRFTSLFTERKFTNSGSPIKIFDRTSRDIGRAWHGIASDVSRVQKSFSRIAGDALALRGFSFGALGIGGALAGGAFAGAQKASSDFANANLTNRQLDLSPGEKDAALIAFARGGMSEGLLNQVAAAKANPKLWSNYAGLGITSQQFQSENAAELSADVLQRAAQQFHKLGASNYGLWADALGVPIDSATARGAASYSDAEWQKMRQNYNAYIPQLARPQSELDEGTETHARFQVANKKLMNSFEGLVMKLAPSIAKIETSVGSIADALSRSPQVAKDFNTIADALDKFANWIHPGTTPNNAPGTPQNPSGTPAINAPTTNSPSSNTNKPTGAAGIVAKGFGAAITGTASAGRAFYDAQTKPGLKFTAAPNRKDLFNSLENQYGFGPGTLSAFEQVESSGGKNNVGEITDEGWRAMGPFQFSPADIARYGIKDPGDEAEEAKAAARKLNDLMQRFKGNRRQAYAAYGAGEGTIQKLVDRYQDKWESHLSPKTEQYLLQLQGQGIDLDPFHTTAGAIDSSHVHEAVRTLNAPSSKAGVQGTSGGAAGRNRPIDVNAKANVNLTIINQTGASINTTMGGIPR